MAEITCSVLRGTNEKVTAALSFMALLNDWDHMTEDGNFNNKYLLVNPGLTNIKGVLQWSRTSRRAHFPSPFLPHASSLQNVQGSRGQFSSPYGQMTGLFWSFKGATWLVRKKYLLRRADCKCLSLTQCTFARTSPLAHAACTHVPS